MDAREFELRRPAWWRCPWQNTSAARVSGSVARAQARYSPPDPSAFDLTPRLRAPRGVRACRAGSDRSTRFPVSCGADLPPVYPSKQTYRRRQICPLADRASCRRRPYDGTRRTAALTREQFSLHVAMPQSLSAGEIPSPDRNPPQEANPQTGSDNSYALACNYDSLTAPDDATCNAPDTHISCV